MLMGTEVKQQSIRTTIKQCTKDALAWKSTTPLACGIGPTFRNCGASLKIVEFLRTQSDGLEALTRHPYNLNLRRHSKYPNLVLFHYQQTLSKLTDSIVREARGTVLDEANNWEPVCLPYLKFDNYNPLVHEIVFNPHNTDADTITTVFEKHDGTLINLYYAYDTVNFLSTLYLYFS